MRPDRPLLGSILFLAAGLGAIFGYCHGTTSLSELYSVGASTLHIDLITTGPAVLCGLGLTAIGLLLLAWASIAAIAGLIMQMFSGVKEPQRLFD
jgi:hypothetical protein